MTNSIADIVEAEVLFVIGSNTTESHPVISLQMKKAVREHGAKLILADPRRIGLIEFAHLHLRQHPGTDVALVNAMGHVILSEGLEDREFIAERTEGFEAYRQSVANWTPERASQICGVDVEDIVKAARIYASSRTSAIFWAMGITQHTTGTDNVKSLANLALLTGNLGKPGTGCNPLRGQNNVQGACDLGGLPNVYPGYQPVANEQVRAKFSQGWDVPVERLSPDPGLTVTEIMDGVFSGAIHAIYVMGENPMLSDPDLNHVEAALQKVDFLVVQDIFLNETGEMAEVVLPAVSFAEREGTFTNTERRVHLVRKAFEPTGQGKPDWMILKELARTMGVEWRHESPSDVFDEIAELTPSYAGISHARLEERGIQWPCPTPEHPGTPILHVGEFARGKGLFSAVDYVEPAEMPDEEYPLILSTGRILFHWHGGTMSRRSPGLDSLAPEAEVEIHPDDARTLGIREGEAVRVSSRRGEVVANAVVTRRSPSGTVFMNFHFSEAAANELTPKHLDPQAKIPEYKVSAVRIEPVAEKIVD